jgi:hypothetical protein
MKPIPTLSELESAVERHNLSFVEAGEALAEIRAFRFTEMEGSEAEERFEQVTSFSSFRNYCLAKWGLPFQRVRQLINAAEVFRLLEAKRSTPVDPLPKTEFTIRPLTALRMPSGEFDAEGAHAVWNKVVAIFLGNPSAKQVGLAVQAYKAGRLDGLKEEPAEPELKQEPAPTPEIEEPEQEEEPEPESEYTEAQTKLRETLASTLAKVVARIQKSGELTDAQIRRVVRDVLEEMGAG